MRATAAAAFALVLLAGPAWAISVQEVIDLSRAQVGDDIIIAKIKSDRSTFTLGAKDILDLKNAGVSDRVILAMVEAERPPLGVPQPAPAYAPEPSGASDDSHQAPRQEAPQSQAYEVVVPVYRTVYVPTCSYYPTYSYYAGGCGPYYPRVYRSYGCGGYYPYRYAWGPSYGFSYFHHGRHSSWGVHFGW